MSNRRFLSRVFLIAVALLFLSAGELSQKEAWANCYQNISYYKEHYYLIRNDCEGCESVRDVVGWEYMDCENNYYSEGNLNCGGLIHCSTTYYECAWICN